MLLLVMSSIWAVVCGRMAEDRNRDVLLGFIAGFFFGLLSVAYYYIVGDKE